MLEEQYETIKSLFEKYVREFSLSNKRLILEPNLQLKYVHTKRVCNLLDVMADSLKMNKSERFISLTIGLLHDIGRFCQIQFYQTFSDNAELNHAESGLLVIQEQNMLSHLSKHEQEIIYYSIRNHNARALPEDIPDHIKHFALLIRDADKLDIIKIAIDHFQAIKQPKNSKLRDIICEVSLEEYCSQKVIDDVLENRAVSFTDIKTIYDEMLMHLSWIESLNFDFSVRHYTEAGYIDFIASILPKKTLQAGIGEYVKSIIADHNSLVGFLSMCRYAYQLFS